MPAGRELTAFRQLALLFGIHPSGSGGDSTGGWQRLNNIKRVPTAEYWCPAKGEEGWSASPAGGEIPGLPIGLFGYFCSPHLYISHPTR
jgi:hypothetical protein